MKILALMLASAAAFAQSYPSSVYTPLIAANNLSTTLSSPMAAIDTVAVVASSAGWTNNMLAYICDATSSTVKCTGTYEIMKVTNVAGNVLTVTRGLGGTSAVAHATGKAFLNAPVALYNKTVSDEILAVETALGANLSNVPPVTSLSALAYNFATQHPAGTISVGTTVITMTPVPPGVNGTDVGHWLYISGTGTPEACLINGGAGTSGQTSGQISISCVNPHSAGWSINSASGGIREALQGVAVSGGMVVMPPATYTLYAQLIVPSNVTLAGVGAASIVKLCDNGWPPTTATGPFYNSDVSSLVAIASVQSSSNVVMRDFVLDMNGATNHNLVQGGSAISILNSMHGGEIARITVKGMQSGGRAIAGLGNSGTGLLIQDNTVLGYGGSYPGACSGGIFTQIPNTLIKGNYLENLCDEYLVSNNTTDTVFIGNTAVADYATPLTSGGHQEIANRTSWLGNIMRGAFETGIAEQSLDAGSDQTDFVAVGNMISCINGHCPVNGIAVVRSTLHTATNNIITGNIIIGGTGSTGGGIFVDAADANTITGNVVRGFTTGIHADSSGRAIIQHNQLSNTTNISCANCTTPFIGPNLTNDAANMSVTLSLALALVNGNNEDVSVSAPIGGGVSFGPNDLYVRVSGPTGAFAIGGVAGGFSGKKLYIVNPTGQTMTIKNQDATSTAANRISTVTGADVTIHAGSSACTLIYDGTVSAWILISTQ